MSVLLILEFLLLVIVYHHYLFFHSLLHLIILPKMIPFPVWPVWMSPGYYYSIPRQWHIWCRWPFGGTKADYRERDTGIPRREVCICSPFWARWVPCMYCDEATIMATFFCMNARFQCINKWRSIWWDDEMMMDDDLNLGDWIYSELSIHALGCVKLIAAARWLLCLYAL